ncbi:PCC domain-containing protein [Rhizobium nepotum]|jgi:predicted DNA-binding protein with PD1-like motif|uniref:PCC domain-containing protein n=1 Tax=Rhizobium TaxID=379 RepID=UPI003CF86A1F
MMTSPEKLPRSIVHPGPETPERFRVVGCHAHPVTLTVRPGVSVNEAIADAFAEQGFDGGYVRLKNVSMKRLCYVMPAAAPDDTHAAWYSESFSMPDGTIVDAGLHIGRRDGQPFLHCHGSWTSAEGILSMGHLLPFEAEFAVETQLEALALDGAVLDAQQDEETNFPLFKPIPQPRNRQQAGLRALLCTVRPNTDICLALEAACAQFGLSVAEVNGIGSLIGADYEDGTTLTAYASEILIRNGRVSPAKGAALDIAMVDLTGHISGGRLVRGKNPVCVTFELLLTERKEAAA